MHIRKVYVLVHTTFLSFSAPSLQFSTFQSHFPLEWLDTYVVLNEWRTVAHLTCIFNRMSSVCIIIHRIRWITTYHLATWHWNIFLLLFSIVIILIFFSFVSLVERGAWNRTCEIAPSPLIGDPKLFLPKWLCNANKKLFKDPFWCNNSQFYFCCKSTMTDTAPKCHVHHPNSICMCALHITMITYWFFSCLKVFEIFHLCGKT